MKRAINHLLALAPALLLMASCETETDRVGGGRQERVLLVSSENVDTRTTIDYELSDYSHLVWNAGERTVIRGASSYSIRRTASRGSTWTR